MIKKLKAKESNYYPASLDTFKEVEGGKGRVNETYILPVFVYVVTEQSMICLNGVKL